MANLDLSKCWISGAPPDPAPDAAEAAEHGALVAFQLHVVRWLNAWLPLAPVAAQAKPGAITYADKRSVVSEVENSLRSVGISLVVGLDRGTRKSAMRNAVLFDPFVFSVSIAENPLTNRSSRGSGLTASQAAELVMLCFSGGRLGSGSCEVIAFSTGGEEGSLQTADVTLQTAYLITPPESLLADD